MNYPKSDVIVHMDIQLKELEARREAVIKSVQLGCNHEELGECDYLNQDWLGSMPPMRICLHCGMSEDGWSWYVLHGEANKVGRLNYDQKIPIRKMDRDDLYRARRGLSIRDAHKGPIARREVTLAQLIEADGDLKKLGIEEEKD